ncbi:hypothetical protein GEV33_001949 [Tenebrio molitor]|uniref:Uncharacterized protein n=1 Tax=Tenebrio molitor TaxID=7067 RepID=A0A8J6HV33_TENMO|nr:hypothetical protein GEV33_001949 [Tenebrio molitor]
MVCFARGQEGQVRAEEKYAQRRGAGRMRMQCLVNTAWASWGAPAAVRNHENVPSYTNKCHSSTPQVSNQDSHN